MDKHIARALLPVVNDLKDYPVWQEFFAYRIKLMQRELEQDNSELNTAKLRGAIQELRRYSSLREEVVRDSKD